MSDILHGSDGVTLSWEDKTTCFMGRQELLRAQEELSYSFLFGFVPPSNCANNGLCVKRARQFPYIFHHDECSLFEVFALKHMDWSVTKGMCSVCVSQVQLDHKSGRRAVWNQLPEFFGLGSWEDIEKAKTNWVDSEQGD